jgi:type II secretion system protein G
MKKQKGFTLIELLVVIAIIGILSSVVLASLSTAREKSRDARRISDIGQVRLALEMFYDSNATYPTSSAVGINYFSGTTTTAYPIAYLTSTGLLPKLPSDPLASQSYIYCAMEASNSAACDNAAPAAAFHIAAILERADNTALTSDSDKTIGAYLVGNTGNCVSGGVDKCYDTSN